MMSIAPRPPPAQGFTYMAFPSWHSSLSFMAMNAMATQPPYAPTMARFTGGVRVRTCGAIAWLGCGCRGADVGCVGMAHAYTCCTVSGTGEVAPSNLKNSSCTPSGCQAAVH